MRLVMPVAFALLAVSFLARAAPDRGNAFLDDCHRRVPSIVKAPRVLRGHGGWLLLPAEIHHLGLGRFFGPDAAKVSLAEPSIADPLPALIDFRDQLARLGVDLLLVPVPSRALVYPEALAARYAASDGGVQRFDVHHQAFYALLRENGVRLYDPWPDLVAAKSDPRGPAFCKQDHHWSGVGLAAVASRIAAQIGSPDWLAAWKAAHGVALESEWEELAMQGDLATMAGGLKPEAVPVRRVGRRGAESLEPVKDDPDSPVVLLGDSNVLVFHSGRTKSVSDNMHTTGAGLADQLALELGFALDVVGALGSGTDAARVNLRKRFLSQPGYAAKKKLVIWCFNITNFTWHDGWRKLPLAPFP